MATGSSGQDEYGQLQLALIDLGMYEDGMELEEMRQVWSAVERSISDQPQTSSSAQQPSRIGLEIQRALTAGEKSPMEPLPPSDRLTYDSRFPSSAPMPSMPCGPPLPPFTAAFPSSPCKPPLPPRRGRKTYKNISPRRDERCYVTTHGPVKTTKEIIVQTHKPINVKAEKKPKEIEIEAEVHHSENWSPTAGSYKDSSFSTSMSTYGDQTVQSPDDISSLSRDSNISNIPLRSCQISNVSSPAMTGTSSVSVPMGRDSELTTSHEEDEQQQQQPQIVQPQRAQPQRRVVQLQRAQSQPEILQPQRAQYQPQVIRQQPQRAQLQPMEEEPQGSQQQPQGSQQQPQGEQEEEEPTTFCGKLEAIKEKIISKSCFGGNDDN